MSNLILVAVLFVGVAAQAEAPAARWRTARIRNIAVLESLPVQYDITYVAQCNDLETKVIKFTDGGDTVMGLAVKRGEATDCTHGEPPMKKKTIRVEGDATDSGTVKILR